MLSEGSIDAVIATVSAPARRIQQAAVTGKIRFVRIPQDIRARLTEASANLVPIRLRAGTYPNQEEAIDTVAVTALLVASEGLPGRDVHRVLTAVFDKINFLDAGSAAGSLITRPTARIGVTIPMHPAAIEFLGAVDDGMSVSGFRPQPALSDRPYIPSPGASGGSAPSRQQSYNSL